MADRYEDLRTFVTAVNRGGVTAAAASLGIAKSAVSRRISELEQRLNAQLIERSTRTFRVTSAGELYHARATRLLAEWMEMDEGVSLGEMAVVVVIAAPASVLTHLVAPRVSGLLLRQQLPPIRLTNDQRDGSADLTLFWAPTGRDDRETRILGEIPRVVCAAPTYLDQAGTPHDLWDLEKHAGISTGGAGDIEWTFAHGAIARPRIVLTAPTEDAALGAAIAGAGLVQLDAFVTTAAIREGRLKPVLDDKAASPRTLSMRFGGSAAAAAHAVADALRDEVAARR